MSYSSPRCSDMPRDNDGWHSLPATHMFIHKWDEPYLPLFVRICIMQAELREKSWGTEPQCVVKVLQVDISLCVYFP